MMMQAELEGRISERHLDRGQQLFAAEVLPSLETPVRGGDTEHFAKEVDPSYRA